MLIIKLETPSSAGGFAKFDSSGESSCVWGWSLLRSPSPQPSPPGEGETFARGLVIRLSLVVVCLRNERQRSGIATATSEFSSTVPALSLSLRERAGVRGNRTPAVFAASASGAAPQNYLKGHMALSHSSFQASGFAEVAELRSERVQSRMGLLGSTLLPFRPRSCAECRRISSPAARCSRFRPDVRQARRRDRLSVAFILFVRGMEPSFSREFGKFEFQNFLGSGVDHLSAGTRSDAAQD
jgi:hypothetical protein